MSSPEFDSCKTVADTNRVFKDLFIKMKARHDNSVAHQLREEHRRQMERIVYELRATDAPAVKRERSDADLHGPTVRNWSMANGLLAPGERINKTHKDAWRAAHPEHGSESPREGAVVPVEPPDVLDATELPPASVVRLWAALHGIECGKRGRLQPSVIRAYLEREDG